MGLTTQILSLPWIGVWPSRYSAYLEYGSDHPDIELTLSMGLTIQVFSLPWEWVWRWSSWSCPSCRWWRWTPAPAPHRWNRRTPGKKKVWIENDQKLGTFWNSWFVDSVLMWGILFFSQFFSDVDAHSFYFLDPDPHSKYGFGSRQL